MYNQYNLMNTQKEKMNLKVRLELKNYLFKAEKVEKKDHA